MGDKAILLGPIISELYWEIGRFAPLLPYLRSHTYLNQDVKYIILTRQDRFDLYGQYADILLPLKIEGDYTKYLPNCFRLNGFPASEYEAIAKHFYNKYSERFKILKHLYPNISNKEFIRKNQFPQKEMSYKFKPRNRNFELIDQYIPNDGKPIIILAPRYRKGFNRNWKYWPELYDNLYNSRLMNDCNFVVCGKPGEYVPDEKNRFYDINKISLDDNSSLIGLLIVLLKKAYLTIGSQSAIPNLSLLMGVKAIEWGHQKSLHTRVYNIKNTPVVFLDDHKYNLQCSTIFKTISENLSKVGKTNESKKRISSNKS